MKIQYKIIFFVLILLCIGIFNFSYFANSGLLIGGLKNAKIIHSKNAKQHVLELQPNLNHLTQEKQNALMLSTFAMDKFFTKNELFVILEKIKSLRKHWIKRNVAMSTLGTASYLDGQNIAEYVKKSVKSNIFMKEHFSWVYDKLIHYFQQRCPQSNIKFKTNAALPGFHIFECNKIFSLPVASVHKDMQWNRLTFDETKEEIDDENTLSFTLALELPDGGGGLYTFENPPTQSIFIPRPLIHSFSKKTKINYKEGWMVCHNGQTYHMIAPCKESKTKSRITLQGHGVYEKKSNTWYLYW